MRLRIALGMLGLVTACADIAGIEAGHLRDDAITGQAGTTIGGSTDLDAGPTAQGGSLAGSAGQSSLAGTGGTTGGASGIAGSGMSGSGGMTTDAGPDDAGATGGTGGDGAGPACPSDMVRATSTDGYAFCIDAYEVTNRQYLAFTKANSAGSTTQGSQCGNNSTFLPSSHCNSALTDIPSRDLPVVCVDWCDAAAYCASVNKRLCGRIGGVENPQSDSANANACEWYAACVGADDRRDSGNDCNDSDFDPNASEPKAPADIPDCEGGFAGIFNLSGNVAEWENSCAGESSGATCNTRGGSYQDGPFELHCSTADGSPRQTQSETIGFRCCANAH